MSEFPESGAVRTVAIIGNYLPRRCGIATFTTDLGSALASALPEIDCFVLAMNDLGQSYAYPERVRFELNESDIASYRRAADFLNVNAVDVVSLQHEYGIFGGKAGAHVLTLARELRMPIVTTLHTILPEPSSLHRAVMEELTELSERVVVMSARGAELLQSVHGVPERKIDLIPHGIPPALPPRRSKYHLGVEGRSVILTFGLLSPDKGIESVIEALPAVATKFPHALYVVLGATHPHVKAQHGEAYRLSLEHQAQRLGVDANIIFHDRFVSQNELSEFLAAADIYITAYLKAEQTTSGTLAYAVGAGKAIISTPYAYAREMLADGRGMLVPWRDPGAIAREICELLGDEAKRREMAARAAEYGSRMVWPRVAQSYYESFGRAREDHAARRRTMHDAKSSAKRHVALPEINLRHVQQMTDATGMLQHALFNIPRYDDGYCLDDNARALLLMVLIEDAGTDDGETVRRLATRYLAFVSHAFDAEHARFRNFMAYNRSWLEASGSEDSHARGVWALGAVVGRSSDPGKQSLAGVLFQRALPTISTFTSPRAWALGLLGIAEYLRAFQGDTMVETQRALLAERLLELYQRASSLDWPWFEARVTYENARLSQAMLATGALSGSDEMIAVGLRSLEWLASIQGLKNGDFAPVGSNGFYEQGGVKAAFDQQPLEAWAMVSACLEARRISGDERWGQYARRAFAWFLGQNHLQRAPFDAATGGCRDGLHADRINENQGAESTLSFQLALLEMRNLELTPALRLVALRS
ncbi:MAG TPA: glycosyltransferase family 4 protein [Polyangiaceae bacterium]|jgi:glycosyltransferase involved in cell wall biosynthesis|nr:glycosyltransferase family 4 protein [Polyangiaceae bacterium]